MRPLLGVHGISCCCSQPPAHDVVFTRGHAPSCARCGRGGCAGRAGGLPVQDLTVAWTEPTGTRVTVSLLQGNMSRTSNGRGPSARHAGDLSAHGPRQRCAPDHPARNRVAAVPARVPAVYLMHCRARQRNNGDLLLGCRNASRRAILQQRGFAGSASTRPTQEHLVPFGDSFRYARAWHAGIQLSIPLQDLRAAAADSSRWRGVNRLPINICYETPSARIFRPVAAGTLLSISARAWSVARSAPAASATRRCAGWKPGATCCAATTRHDRGDRRNGRG